MKAVVCPVCYGNGRVSPGFYNQVGGLWASTSGTPETCRSCSGKGWVEVHDEEYTNSLYHQLLQAVGLD